ncbi:unnamed protein product, partial [Prorocentrum cordatum]
MTDAVCLAAAACGRGPPARKVPELPEGRELVQTLRALAARRRVTRDGVERAIYNKDIVRNLREISTANRALQRCLHEAGNPRVRAPRRAQPVPIHNQLMNAEGEIEDDPLRIKELLEREYGNTFRASDGEEPVGISAYLTHFTTEDFSALCDMKAMKAPGMGGVVAEVLQALDSGFLASLAAVFENRFRGVPEYARDQAWPKHIIQLMKKKGDKHALKGYRYACRIFSMRMLTEKAREWNSPIFIVGGDIEAAFDRVSHRSVEETLRRE